MVGTPGRIKDHIQNNKLDLTKLKHVVLDEVDQMLDMGFAEQVEEILASSYKKGKVTCVFFVFGIGYVQYLPLNYYLHTSVCSLLEEFCFLIICREIQ